MIKEVKYNGHTAQPSDFSCADGDLSVALNAVPEDGAIKPIMQPKMIMKLSEGEAVKFIHTTSAYKHYIVYDGTGKISYVDEKDLDPEAPTLVEIETLKDVTHFNSVGNTLIAFTDYSDSRGGNADGGVYYFLWKGGAYHALGNHIPDVEISFGLVGHPRLWSLSDESKKTFSVQFDKINEDDIHNEFTDNNKLRITEQVMAKVNKFIADQTVNKGRFCFPFFVRYALRLYDGSLTYHSAPILMNPSTTTCPVVMWSRLKGKGSYTDATWCDIMLVASDLDYRVLHNDDFSLLGDWKDIIKSVDVFISKPIYTYDQDGKITNFFDTDNQNTKFIGRLAAKYTVGGSSSSGSGSSSGGPSIGVAGQETGASGPGIPSQAENWYSEWKYSLIYQMYYSATGTYPVETFHLPEFTEGKVRETIENASAFYKLCSVDIDEIIKQDASKRYDIVIEDDYLQSLVTREAMTDDYLSRDRLYAKYSFSYNQRLNLSGLRRKPFNGFYAQSMFAYCNTWYEILNNDFRQMRDTNTKFGYAIYVYIKENGEDRIVASSFNDYPLAPLSELNSWGTYFFYPNVNAYKMAIGEYGLMHVIDLKPHEFLNGAYAVLDYEATRSYASSFDRPTISSGENSLIPIPNKIYTSEVNNPFYFPLLGINTVGTGEIKGICSAAKALSQGQFGQFPLYAFSTDGVWALEVSSKGTYSAKQPITRDVCISDESITQLDSAVLFATARGIMLISGSNAQCITDKINARDLFSVSKLPKKEAIVQIYNSVAGKVKEEEKIKVEDIELMPFLEFVAGCRMVYDYTRQRIIMYNSSKSYAYVYSLRSQEWGMMLSNITEAVNSYPEALAMTNGNKLVDFSKRATDEDKDEWGTVLLLTRPIALDNPVIFKTIDTIIQRGIFDKDNIKQVLFGSNDYTHWQPVWSSNNMYMRGFSGSPYKVFRLAVIAKLKDTESISEATIQFTQRQLNQPR